MGNTTSTPNTVEKHSLHADADRACAEAADLLRKADVVFVGIGSGLDILSAEGPIVLLDEVDDIEEFYGFWGERFNNARYHDLLPKPPYCLQCAYGV